MTANLSSSEPHSPQHLTKCWHSSNVVSAYASDSLVNLKPAFRRCGKEKMNLVIVYGWNWNQRVKLSSLWKLVHKLAEDCPSWLFGCSTPLVIPLLSRILPYPGLDPAELAAELTFSGFLENP